MRRLAGSIGPRSRDRLGRALAEHVATTSVRSGLTPLIVTGDAEVAAWTVESGLHHLDDPGQGLDAASAAGAEWARDRGRRWLVLHADLPLLDTGDIAALLEPIAGGRDVIAPSADGGTSAISAGGGIEFAFGVASFHRHLPRLSVPTVVARPGLLQDLDSPDDLVAARRHPVGRWLGALEE